MPSGVTKSLKTDSRPLERKPGVSLKDLLGAIAVGVRDEDIFSSLANRLIRMDKQIGDAQREQFKAKANGKTVTEVARNLLLAYNPDTLDELEAKIKGENPNLSLNEIDEKVKQQHEQIIEQAAEVFTGELNEFVENVRKSLDQIIDTINPDKVIKAGWDEDEIEQANALVKDFAGVDRRTPRRDHGFADFLRSALSTTRTDLQNDPRSERTT